MNTEITGGVSPLKKKRQVSRGGKHAGKATAREGGKTFKYTGGRGGYAKSVGVRGGGGRNVGGYNIHTRFQPTERFSDAASTKTKKPYSYDKDGNLVVDTGYEYKQDPGKVVKKGEKVPYENWEKACHPDRKAKQIAEGTFDQAAFDAECAGYKAHTKKPGYKSSGGKTVTKEKTIAGQKYKRKVTDGKPVVGSNTDAEGWYKI